MALQGNWKAGTLRQAGALKWGTGYDPVHASRDIDGRNIAPMPSRNIVPTNIVDEIEKPEDGYCDEDSSSLIFGYGFQTGTAEIGPWNTSNDRNSTHDYPPYNYGSNGVTSGAVIRSINKGATAGSVTKLIPSETVSEGWRNKNHDGVEDSVISDPAQYEMQTSMTQRDKTRAGSQAAQGRANAERASIASRITGQKLRFFSGGERHYDMKPKQQDMVIRPWWARNAATGYREWMAPNEMYVSQPRNRVAPTDPNPGPDVTSDSGYVDEDVQW